MPSLIEDKSAPGLDSKRALRPRRLGEVVREIVKKLKRGHAATLLEEADRAIDSNRSRK